MEQRHVYGGVVAAVGILLGAIQIVHAFRQFDVPVAIAFDAVPFVALALAVTYTGYWLTAAGEYEQDLPRIMGWAVGGTVVFVSIAALMLFSQRVTTGALGRTSFVAIDNITVGVLSGTLVGLYDARSRCRYRNLQTERDRIEAFANKAADLNNYGRALAQSDDVESISAFCIEAVATLLGTHESAFVEVTDETIYLIDNTMIGVDHDALVELVEATLEQDTGSVVVHDGGLPADLDRTVGTGLTVLVSTTPDRSFVLVGVADAEDALGETDRQLLELLVSHASMALDACPSARPELSRPGTGSGERADS